MIQGMGSIDSLTHTQKDGVESDLSALKLSCSARRAALPTSTGICKRMKALSKSPLGAGLVNMVIGSDDQLAQNDLHIPAHASNRTSPSYLFPHSFPRRYRLKSSRPFKLAGLHEAITPAPTSLASELQGLLARKTTLENKYASKKIKDSFSQALPTHIHTALKKKGPGNPRKNGLPTGP
eukprot:1138360-Pelagomonas_calceolata.AAC.2